MKTNFIVNGQDYDGGYKTAMLTIYLIIDELLDELDENQSDFELAKQRIKGIKELCKEEFLGEEENDEVN